MSEIIHAVSTEETDLAAHTSVLAFKPHSVKIPSVETERRICSHGVEADECLECHTAEGRQ